MNKDQRNNSLVVTIFSEPQVQLMLHSLEPFEAYLNQVDSSLPNVVFAKDTVILLRGKLHEMLRKKNYAVYFSLDGNEVIILHSAVLSFLYGLSVIAESKEKHQMIEDCNALISHFAPMVGVVKLKD